MGMLIEFFAERAPGDVDRIVAVVEDDDWPDSRHPFLGASADFSLHLSPDDLDPLIEAICARAGAAPTTLTRSLVEPRRQPDALDATKSAEVVAPELVRMIASVSESDASAIGADWFRRLGEDPSDNATIAIGELIRLCRHAAAERLAVVFAWGM